MSGGFSLLALTLGFVILLALAVFELMHTLGAGTTAPSGPPPTAPRHAEGQHGAHDGVGEAIERQAFVNADRARLEKGRRDKRPRIKRRILKRLDEARVTVV